MENIMNFTIEKVQRKECFAAFHRLFWIYVICGVAGFFIETAWCWFDFQEFTSRTSNLFFPISCVWGFGGVILHLFTVNDRWKSGIYILVKCTILGAAFEFLCGYLGECLLEVTFWDYSGMPLHLGKYINLPFCMVWGIIGVFWVQKIYPYMEQKLVNKIVKIPQAAVKGFVIFIAASQILTGAALLRMHERQQQIEAGNYAEHIMDRCFTDQTLQSFFPKMKSTVTGEKICVRHD